MKNKKLIIETHQSNRNSKLKVFNTNQTQNIKSIKIYKNLFKARLEDRHRIKGISYSTNKRKHNNLLLYKLKKQDEAATFELNEANFLRTLRDYNQLKHEIYLKELKEKKLKTKEANLNEKIIKRDINYTFIKETLYQFMRFKKSHNEYTSNLLKNQNEIKRADKIAKSNFINKTMKNVTEHFHQIEGKIDMGDHRKEEILNEKEYDHLLEQISKSRKKNIKSFQEINNAIKTDSPTFSNLLPKKSAYLPTHINQLSSYFKDSDKNEEQLSSNKIRRNKNKTGRQIDNKKISNFTAFYRTDSNVNKDINSYINNEKKMKSESRKDVNRFSHFIPSKRENKENKRAKSSKYKTHILSNPIKINNEYNKNTIKTSIFNIKENDNDSISSNSSNIYNSNKKNKNSKEIQKTHENSLINLEMFKKNYLIKEKRNPAYWNNNMRRMNTAGNRKHKVINKPIYVAKISDFIKEYNRIKSTSKNTRKRLREKHFTTLENIDKISKTKEDLLMFLLKNKYFSCKFPQKKVKTISKKELFVKRLNNYVNIIDNPYSLATRELKAELRKYEDL